MKSILSILSVLLISGSLCLGSEYDELNRQLQEQLSAFTNSPTREAYRAIMAEAAKMIELDNLDPRGYKYLVTLDKGASERLFPQSTAERKYSQTISKYALAIWDRLKLFENNPTEQDFKKLQFSIEQMISMNELSSVGYKQFAQLYNIASGIFMDESERLDRTIQLIKRYQSTAGREDDLSNLLEFYSSSETHRDNSERLRKKTELMEQWDNQPECVLEARRLIAECNLTKDIDATTALLEKAAVILDEGLNQDPNNYKIYAQRFEVSIRLGAYADAFVMWRLAYQLGSADDVVIQNMATSLYLKAMQYAMSGEVSENNTGGDYMMYFIWLNRTFIAETLPPQTKTRLDDVLSEAEQRIETLED